MKMAVGEETRSALHAGEETFEELADVAVDWGIPIITGIGGYFAGPGIFGGVNSLYNTLSSAGTTAQTYAGRVAGWIMGIIFLLIGAALWSLGESKEMWRRALGRAFGGFALGTGARYIVAYGIMNTSGAPSGIIDSLTGSLSTSLGGNAPGAGGP
jgi:putative flippase GtrA